MSITDREVIVIKKEIKPFKVKSVVIGEGNIKICMPMVGQTEEDLLADAREALLLAPDVVEWRADYFAGVQEPDRLLTMLGRIREQIPDVPLLFTCRDVSEGGFAKIETPERTALIEKVIDRGDIDLLDIELAAVKSGLSHLVNAARKKGIGVVLSNHYFTKTPSRDEIVDILCEEQALGADIAKIAVMPNSPGDVLALLSATHIMHAERAEIPIITMSMGKIGLASRVCGGLFGCALTFGAGRNASAPGQVGIRALRESLTLFEK